MKYKSLGIGLMIIAGILVWQLAAINKPSPRSLNSEVEENVVDIQQPVGEVLIEAHYLAGKSDENEIVFEVSLNTHSVDLDGIDFQKSVVMQKDGQTFPPLAVETSGSSHHRSAMLSFPRVGVPLKIVFLGTKEVGRQEFGFEKLP